VLAKPATLFSHGRTPHRPLVDRFPSFGAARVPWHAGGVALRSLSLAGQISLGALCAGRSNKAKPRLRSLRSICQSVTFVGVGRTLTSGHTARAPRPSQVGRSSFAGARAQPAGAGATDLCLDGGHQQRPGGQVTYKQLAVSVTGPWSRPNCELIAVAKRVRKRTASGRRHLGPVPRRWSAQLADTSTSRCRTSRRCDAADRRSCDGR